MELLWVRYKAQHIWPERRLYDKRLRRLALAVLPKLAVTKSQHLFAYVKREDSLALLDMSQQHKVCMKCRVSSETSINRNFQTLLNYKPTKNYSNGTTLLLMRSQ